MERRTTLILTFGFLVFLIVGLYLFTDWFSKATGYFVGIDENAKLAYCLDGKGAEFYCTKFLPECEKQRNLFGSSLNSIYTKECGKNNENCPNLKEVPAWYIDKEIYYGFKTLQELREISGCIDK